MKSRGSVHSVFLFLFAIVMLTVFILAIIYFKQVNNFVEASVDNGGLWAVFGLVFIVELLVQPIGPEVPASAAILFGMPILPVILVAIFASFLAGTFDWGLGRHGGLVLAKRVCGTRNYKNVCYYFSKYGHWTLLVSAITPIPYVPFCWLSGAFGYKYRDFFLFGVIPRTIRIVAVLGVVSLGFSLF